jgi:dephospho-CoA kinase
MIKIWGVTGPIGSGKSSVLDLLRGWGLDVIDADACVTSLWSQTPPELRAALLAAFGTGVKEEIRAKVANSPLDRARLEGILHPHVFAELARRLAQARGPVVFIEGTRLQAGPALPGWEGLLYVDAPTHLRRARVESRNPQSAAELWTLSQGLDWDGIRTQAQSTLINDGSREDLKLKTETWLKNQGIRKAKQ